MKQLPAAGLWAADPSTTTASFEAANFIVNRVPGTLAVRSGAVQTDERGRPTSVSAVLDASSIATGNPRRDRDLRGPRFFDVDEHPDLRFASTSITPDDTGAWTVEGSLSRGGHQAPMTLTVRVSAPGGSGSVQVAAHGSVDRAAVGIKAPGFMIGRTIQITVDAVLSMTPSRV